MRQINLPMPIWDLPTRLFHWCLVLLVAFLWVSGENRWNEWHMYAGYTLLSLLIFRVIWGFIGSDTARFLFFLKSPIEALRHLSHITKREPDHEVGHNAAGGWMVLGLLGLLFAQVITGLGSNDDISMDGPYARALGKELSDQFASWHIFLFRLLQIAVALHILAIVTYAVLKRQDLVRPMVTGKKTMPGAMPPPRIVSWKLGLVVWLLAVALVVVVVKLAP